MYNYIFAWINQTKIRSKMNANCNWKLDNHDQCKYNFQHLCIFNYIPLHTNVQAQLI